MLALAVVDIAVVFVIQVQGRSLGLGSMGDGLGSHEFLLSLLLALHRKWVSEIGLIRGFAFDG